MDAAISIRGLTKRYRDFWGRARVTAIEGLDLEIERGRRVGLLGPNGSGKTTTIKVLLGLVHATAGEVRVLGAPPGDLGARARIGFLPEESYLYPFLSARETLDIFGRIFGLDRGERHRRSEALLDRVGLAEEARGRPIRTYSRGMARRVGLAQALLNEPELLLLDEPTTGLDPVVARAVKGLIEEVAAAGTTVLLSSHLLGDVEDLCDRLAVIDRGRVIARGGIDEMLLEPNALAVRITNPPPDAAERIAAALEGTGAVIERAAPPRRRLDDLFDELIS